MSPLGCDRCISDGRRVQGGTAVETKAQYKALRKKIIINIEHFGQNRSRTFDWMERNNMSVYK